MIKGETAVVCKPGSLSLHVQAAWRSILGYDVTTVAGEMRRRLQLLDLLVLQSNAVIEIE